MLKMFITLVRAIFKESIAIYNGKDPAESDLVIDDMINAFETSINQEV